MIRRYSSWLWLAAALLAVALASLLSSTQSTPPPLASHSARPDGALAAYLWLQRLGRPITVDTKLDTQHLSAHATLLLLTPQPRLSRAQARQLVGWTEGGGHLVVAAEGDSASSLLALLGLSLVPGGGGAVRVVQPLLAAPSVRYVAGEATTIVSGNPHGATALAAADGPVLLYRPLGRGVLWLLTARELLDNAHISKADNRRLFLNLAGPTDPVTFEEYRPAVSSPGSGWLTTTVWGAAFLFALLVVIIYRWLSGLRLGPALPSPEQQPRLSAEYVTSLARLMQQARRRGDILGIYQRALQRSIAERYGTLDGLAPERRAEVEPLLAPVGKLSEEELRDRVAAIIDYQERIRRERV